MYNEALPHWGILFYNNYMHLKKLELSGFKSFAKTTVLEFPSKITAIVGPNGSGKSNITEGIRWVLGEQSMKSLRGKKGEDLIWNGSPQVPRMGKASVTLFFDNSDGKMPIEFEEVVLSRKIFRDGLNEYYLNDAQVRLKDVVELMARVGLGESKHNIISQGEVDRLLLSSARDRREMLEEALGLRVYQIKKRETERKLEQTEENMKQVEALVREVTPHLKFLRGQAEKSKTRGMIENELRQFEHFYFLKEKEEIEREKRNFIGQSEPLKTRRDLVKKEIDALLRLRREEEKKFIRSEDERKAERTLGELLEKRQTLERELGRLEGRLEAERGGKSVASLPHTENKGLNPEFTKELVHTVRGFLRDTRALLLEEDRFEVIRSHLGVLLKDLEDSVKKIENGDTPHTPIHESRLETGETERAIQSLQIQSQKIGQEMARLQEGEREIRERASALRQSLKEADAQLRTKQDEERDLSLGLERFRFDEERGTLREKKFFEDMATAGFSAADLTKNNVISEYGHTSEELRKKTERLRIRLEEVGGIDPSVEREYEETNTRHQFLVRELEDLKQAAFSLRALVKELDQHLKKDFHEGFAKVKEEFHNYFRIIFGGGKGSLDLVVEHRNEEDMVSDEEFSQETGIEISVDLPRKRIQGLAMLSGGERALTAIALLFAITAVNPPPFLILDETDAALDEANSQRYSAILKELSKKTQLLLVTHNRETMKCAGILYGVTMGDDGVSKFLSLKFEEAEVYTNR